MLRLKHYKKLLSTAFSRRCYSATADMQMAAESATETPQTNQSNQNLTMDSSMYVAAKYGK